MMGLESCGMLISAVHTEKGEEALHLLMVDDSILPGPSCAKSVTGRDKTRDGRLASGNSGHRQLPDAEYSPRVLRKNFSGTGGQSEPPHGMAASSP